MLLKGEQANTLITTPIPSDQGTHYVLDRLVTKVCCKISGVSWGKVEGKPQVAQVRRGCFSLQDICPPICPHKQY
eukprot:4879894-Ditylum_brightwellii.AAC.1